jgi:hypothetical protein
MTRALCRSYRATDRNHWDINVIGALGGDVDGALATADRPDDDRLAAIA